MATSARRALAWSFAERYLGLLVSIGSTMLLSRLLTPAEVGIYSLCAAFTAVAGILRDFGVSEYLIQEKDLTPDKLRAAYGIAFAIAWSIGAVIFFGRHAVAAFYAEPRVAEVLLVLTLHFLILPISSPTFALLNRELAFRQIFYLQIVCNATQALTSVTLAWLGFSVMSLAWGPIANVAMQSLILLWLRPREVLMRPGLRELRSVLRFGSMFVSSRAIEVLTRNVHEPVIAKHYGFEAVGLFSRAFGLVDLFFSNVGAAILRVATPAFAAEHRAGRELATPYTKATSIFVAISWPVYGLMAIVAEPLITVMFGAQWAPAAPLASALAISVMPTGLYIFAPQMLSATGHVAIRLRIAFQYAPVHIACVLLAASHALTAVAFVWLVSSLLQTWLYLSRLRGVLQVSRRSLIAPCLPSALVALGSIAAQLSVYRLCVDASLPAVVTILLTAASCAIGWLATARLTRHAAYDELTRLIHAIRLRPR